jgi:hypothetical protein
MSWLSGYKALGTAVQVGVQNHGVVHLLNTLLKFNFCETLLFRHKVRVSNCDG